MTDDKKLNNLDREIEEKRKDKSFLKRLTKRHREEKELYDRLAESDRG